MLDQFLGLPEVLCFEILLFGDVSDRMELSRVNRQSIRLMKKVRTLRILKGETLTEYFQSPSFQEKVKNLLDSPLNQLEILCYKSIFAFANIQNILPLKCAKFYGSSAQCINVFRDSSSYFVKDLTIFHPESFNGNFPSFPGLQSLTILRGARLTVADISVFNFQNLISLTLDDCDCITDVSFLDGIYSLSIIECHNITDISCLRNNSRIAILNCEGIEEYSKSFTNSKSVQLDIGHDDLVVFSSCIYHMKDLEVTGSNAFRVVDQKLMLPMSIYLRSLVIKGFHQDFFLPENQLRDLSISLCDHLLSCANMGHIYKINFDHLSITSLEGLGLGNHTVQLRYCYNLEDFSPLRYCTNITIDHCKGFRENSIESIRGVANIKISTRELLSTYNGITHVELSDRIPVSNLLLLEKCTTVTTITLNTYLLNAPQIITALIPFHHIKKIVIAKYCSCDLKREFSKDIALQESISSAFILEYPHFQDSQILLPFIIFQDLLELIKKWKINFIIKDS